MEGDKEHIYYIYIIHLSVALLTTLDKLTPILLSPITQFLPQLWEKTGLV